MNVEVRTVINVIKNINWLLKINDEEDIELTEAEKIILKNVDSDYEWIARDEDGTLGVYEKKPKKVDDLWSGSYRSFDLFEHLFQFIKWDDEKPYFIADILNNCEVIDDD